VDGNGDGDGIRRLLRERGITWPAPIHHLATVGSTNDWLKEQVRAAAPEWTAVVADEQAAGRGRMGRRWRSLPGDLALSVLLRPSLAPESLTLLPLAVGLAVAEAVRALGCEADLKWPNDVVVEHRRHDERYRKLAGILVEGVSEGGRVQGAVAGVGMNLGARVGDDVEGTATSVRDETGRDVGRDEAAAAVLARLTVWYDSLARGDAASVVEAWTRRALPWWGQAIEARSGDTVVRGTARGLDARGALLIDLDDGTPMALVSGEVHRVRLRSR
jgi:BirA family transcriptional regulator, biotin operon repressor / biotin---[acetyl-CoA-carboxylase] ligase